MCNQSNTEIFGTALQTDFLISVFLINYITCTCFNHTTGIQTAPALIQYKPSYGPIMCLNNFNF